MPVYIFEFFKTSFNLGTLKLTSLPFFKLINSIREKTMKKQKKTVILKHKSLNIFTVTRLLLFYKVRYIVYNSLALKFSLL